MAYMRKDHDVTFVGAGPGDPGLLTLSGRDAIATADLVVYAGSLVSPGVIAFARRDALVVDSAYLTLEESHALIRDHVRKGEHVARIHTGDPSLYGAIAEQIALLERDRISWRIIPGVTAACAAAAAAGISFTTPSISQSLIITREAGRTPMPQAESISQLASHRTSMAIYWSGKLAEKLQADLSRHLPEDCMIICAQRTGWPEEKIFWTTLGQLASCVKQNRLERQCVFLVLPDHGMQSSRSCLYHPGFSHEYRAGNAGTPDAIALEDSLGYQEEMKDTPPNTDKSILDFLDSKGAVDPFLIELPPDNSITDAIIVCGATSGRHARGLADSLGEHCRELGLKYPPMEGYELGEWILADCGDVIVHILQEEARNLYKLEDLWGRSARLARNNHDTDFTADS